MHIAAREVKANGRAHQASCKVRCTHYSVGLRYAVSPLVYSKTGHGFWPVETCGIWRCQTRLGQRVAENETSLSPIGLGTLKNEIQVCEWIVQDSATTIKEHVKRYLQHLK